MTTRDNNPPPPVRLKGVGDSLWVTLNPESPLEDIKQQMGDLFKRLQHLAVDARVVIDTGEGSDHEALIKELEVFLKENFKVGDVTPPPREPMSLVERKRLRDMADSWSYRRSDMLVLSGRVRSGQKVTARKHLLIMGDVNPGAEIFAGGDVLVLGNLSGKAAAGQPDNEESIILALKFKPTQVRIGAIVAGGLPSAGGSAVEFARVENGAIVVDDYLKANPFGRLPWPEVR